ncbi:MAG: adenylate/guanylate cyclase domain-containing protein [Elusimicrobia bacterium]|nr:adenylate/guanylate cyclase domain-containing protein [Elusimicrobiota bacterium]
MSGERTLFGMRIFPKPGPKEASLNALLVLPCFLIGIDTSFSLFFYLAAGVAPSREALRQVVTYGTGSAGWPILLNAALLLGSILAWYRPIWRFIRTRDDALRDVVRRRLSSIYGDLLRLFVLLLAFKIASHVVVFREVLSSRVFFTYNLPAMVFSLAVQLVFSGILIENIVGNMGGPLFELLYDRSELYEPRQGYSMPLVVKIALLIMSTAVVPLLMVYLSLRTLHRVGGFELTALNNLLINSMAPLVIGIGVILGTLQRPIDGLIAKMRRLAEGDFDVKTRIYGFDEVARIKANFNRMVDQLKERETMRETFGKYVSVEVARKLLKSKQVDLGGEEIEATVLFCDIRNFTPMSERMTARQVVDFLNSYFSFVTKPIMEHHGVINKFMGDAVMAVYAPILGSQDHVGDALRSALGMRRALAEFNASGKWPGETRFGIGIQTGALVAGNVGTLARLEYTVIGDTVNVASRLESATKEVGADILVGEDVYRRAKDVMGEGAFRPVGEVGLKGKSAKLTLYAVN